MILELKNVYFNDFHMNLKQMEKNLNKLMEMNSDLIPSTILSIKAKKFVVEFDHPNRCVKCVNHYFSKQNEMNSSIEF